MAIQLEIVTPERRLLSLPVDTVRAPGFEGGFGVLHGHTPYVTALEAGELIYTVGGHDHHYFVGGGFAQVSADRVVVLAESAEAIEEIDVPRAERSLAEANARLKALQEEEATYAMERARVQRATARISMGRRG